MKLNKTGLNNTKTLLALLAILILGIGGWYMLSQQENSSSETQQNDQNTELNQVREFLSTNSQVSYPGSWTVKDSTNEICSDNINGECSEFVDIKSGDGLIVRYVEQSDEFYDRSSCIQYACAEQTVKKIFNTSADEEISVVIVENKTDLGDKTNFFIEGSLYKASSEANKLTEGQQFGVNDKKQLTTGVPYENYYFQLFITFDYVNNSVENIPEKYDVESAEEFLQIDRVQEAIEIIKSFKFN